LKDDSAQKVLFPAAKEHIVTKASNVWMAVVACLCFFSMAASSSMAQGPSGTAGSPLRDQISSAIDETNLVELKGNTHPLARAEFDQGMVPDSLPLEHLLVQLKRSPKQETALETLLEQQQDRDSPNYHQWLTAQEIGTRFGPSQNDIAAVTEWLESHGFQVNAVYPSGMALDISGTAGTVRTTFHTEIHNYEVNGEHHIANASNPAIPAALAPVVDGIALNDFMPRRLSAKARPLLTFSYEGFSGWDVTPKDFATIYNLGPLQAGPQRVTGRGQAIVVIEDSDMRAADWQTFRDDFGLSSFSGTLQQIHPGAPFGAGNCVDPGLTGDETEAALDAELASVPAPDASIVLASCADTSTLFGVEIAARNLIESPNPPAIISVSYGACEASLGYAGNASYLRLWQQAAAEGISVYVSSADGGPATCDWQQYGFVYDHVAQYGLSVNGIASTPYDVSVGGTDFRDYYDGDTSTYWAATNGPFGASALSYIPEMTWDDSCATEANYLSFGYTNPFDFCSSSEGEANFMDTLGSGGGSSLIYSKPPWQSGVAGIQYDGTRDLPDVSLFASNGEWGQGTVICMSDASQGGAPCDYSNPADIYALSYGGTSVAAPEFAGIQALIDQKTGLRQGNANYLFYRLAAEEFGNSFRPNQKNLALCNANAGNAIGGSCVFHDVTFGDTSVPCAPGTPNCFAPEGDIYGVLSTSQQSLQIAYPATPGWDFTTGLGSVNITNLVNAAAFNPGAPWAAPR
jgi:subtilase family serine protease